MSIEMEKLAARHEKEKDPAEKAHLKAEMDQIPVTSGELDQVQQREANRKTADIAAYRQKKKTVKNPG